MALVLEERERGELLEVSPRPLPTDISQKNSAQPVFQIKPRRVRGVVSVGAEVVVGVVVER